MVDGGRAVQSAELFLNILEVLILGVVESCYLAPVPDIFLLLWNWRCLGEYW